MVAIPNPIQNLSKLVCFKCKNKVVRIVSPTQRFYAVIRNQRPHIDCRCCGALNPVTIQITKKQNSDPSI